MRRTRAERLEYRVIVEAVYRLSGSGPAQDFVNKARRSTRCPSCLGNVNRGMPVTRVTQLHCVLCLGSGVLSPRRYDVDISWDKGAEKIFEL